MRASKLLVIVLLFFATAFPKDRVTVITPSLRILSCSIGEVENLVRQQSAEGFFVSQLSAEIVDHSRTNDTHVGGIFRTENPVLLFEKRPQPITQTVAVIDDIVKRLPQINAAGAAGMRLIGPQVVPLRSWSGSVSLDGYLALFEQTTKSTFEYKTVDVHSPDPNASLLELLKAGFRPVSYVTPSIVVLERSSDARDLGTDRYVVLQGYEFKRLDSELRKTSEPGMRVLLAGISESGLLTNLVLEHSTAKAPASEYRFIQTSSIGKLEDDLNANLKEGFRPMVGGVLACRGGLTNDRGMTPPPGSIEVISEKGTSNEGNIKVLDATGKHFSENLASALKDGYSMFQYVSLRDGDYAILSRWR